MNVITWFFSRFSKKSEIGEVLENFIEDSTYWRHDPNDDELQHKEKMVQIKPNFRIYGALLIIDNDSRNDDLTWKDQYILNNFTKKIVKTKRAAKHAQSLEDTRQKLKEANVNQV